MRPLLPLAVLLAALGLTVPLTADDKPAENKPKAEAKTYQVPYRLTIPKHVLIRAKINGKGPFNFILDTGAPALFFTEAVAEKCGVKADNKGWGTCDRFEIEGGVVVPRAKGRVETPFQLEGMNGLGLAGAELHGIIGYNVLARYRMEIDFNKDKMTWTELDYEPKAPMGLGGKGGSGGLDAMGGIMKMLGGLLGRKAEMDVAPRGFLGVELADDKEYPRVETVLTGSPAGKAGIKAGDLITHIQGRSVTNVEDLQRLMRQEKVLAGKGVKLTVQRGKETQTISFTAAEGL